MMVKSEMGLFFSGQQEAALRELNTALTMVGVGSFGLYNVCKNSLIKFIKWEILLKFLMSSFSAEMGRIQHRPCSHTMPVARRVITSSCMGFTAQPIHHSPHCSLLSAQPTIITQVVPRGLWFSSWSWFHKHPVPAQATLSVYDHHSWLPLHFLLSAPFGPSFVFSHFVAL